MPSHKEAAHEYINVIAIVCMYVWLFRKTHTHIEGAVDNRTGWLQLQVVMSHDPKFLMHYSQSN
jgi:hypothetical protein